MREQAELGERAAKVHREEQAAQRKRDRAISSIPNFKEGEDIEEFLLTAEEEARGRRYQRRGMDCNIEFEVKW